MTTVQQIVLTLGIVLIVLSVRENWQPELSAIL